MTDFAVIEITLVTLAVFALAPTLSVYHRTHILAGEVTNLL